MKLLVFTLSVTVLGLSLKGTSAQNNVFTIEDAKDYQNRLNDAGSKLVLIFTAKTWKGKELLPYVRELATHHPDHLIVLNVDLERVPDLPNIPYDHAHEPYYELQRNGVLLDSFYGTVRSTIRKAVEANLTE